MPAIVISEREVTYTVVLAFLFWLYLNSAEVSKYIDAAGGTAFIADTIGVEEAVMRGSSGLAYELELQGLSLTTVEEAAALGIAAMEQGVIP